jgi:hypothetical protein
MEDMAAAEADLEDAQAIYASHLLHGIGTFEEIPASLQELPLAFLRCAMRNEFFCRAG